MKKQELEALRRLEEELLASEYTEEELVDDLDILEDTWQDFADFPESMYNTDDLDVDLEDYSEAVYQDSDQGISPAVLVALTVLLLLVVIFCLLKLLGVV